ncbi:hypothetical protein BENZEMA_76 [Mycobacterium phage Benzema]|nr:hypothetical protein BENZEMA_76 [Mycobacterium phage Benzema]
MAMKDSPEGALRKAAAASLKATHALRRIREAKERADYMLVRGLTESDVYGKHAREGWRKGNDLARWVVVPKGLVAAVSAGDGPMLARNPDYVGEHRESHDILRRYYDPRFGRGWSGYVGGQPYHATWSALWDKMTQEDRLDSWDQNFFRVNTFGFMHYKCQTNCWCKTEAVMD